MNFTNTFCIMDIFSVPGSFQQYVVHMEHSGQCGAEFINMVFPENGTVMHTAQPEIGFSMHRVPEASVCHHSYGLSHSMG